MSKGYKSDWLKKGQRVEELKNNVLIQDSTGGRCLSVEQLLEECKKEVWQGLIVGFLVGILTCGLIMVLATIMR